MQAEAPLTDQQRNSRSFARIVEVLGEPLEFDDIILRSHSRWPHFVGNGSSHLVYPLMSMPSPLSAQAKCSELGIADAYVFHPSDPILNVAVERPITGSNGVTADFGPLAIALEYFLLIPDHHAIHRNWALNANGETWVYDWWVEQTQQGRNSWGTTRPEVETPKQLWNNLADLLVFTEGRELPNWGQPPFGRRGI